MKFFEKKFLNTERTEDTEDAERGKSMAVSIKDVENAAKLARLSFSEDEKEALVDDLNTILGFVDKLNELDTDDVDIVVNPYYIENKFREDEVEQSMELRDVLRNAPDCVHEYILVPKVI